MKQHEVISCIFSSWYKLFSDITIKSRILPLSTEVLDYLLSDGSLVLPEGSNEFYENTNVDSDEDDASSENGKNWNMDGHQVEAPGLEDFDRELKQAIRALGGKVFPKLNWSSPKDAVWISMNNSLTCTCPAEIYLLLKSSDFVTHDLTQPFDQCDDYNGSQQQMVKYELVLRRWHDMNPAAEFRCFVRNKVLQAVSQRHCTDFYEFIKEDNKGILEDIQQLFTQTIRDKFPEKNYVFDVFRRRPGKVYVIDFNPYGTVTDGLLFEWEELLDDKLTPQVTDDGNAATSTQPAFRYVQDPRGVLPGPYGCYAMPKDFVDLTTGQDPHKLIDLLKLKQQHESSSESEGSEHIL